MSNVAAKPSTESTEGRQRRLLKGAVLLTLVCTVSALLAGPGTRLDWWDYRTGFSVLRVASVASLVGGFLALAALLWGFRTNRWSLVAPAAITVITALLTFILPFPLQWSSGAPLIHDITTDTENPPAFRTLAAMRAATVSGAAYGGADVAAAQKRAYPDIAPVSLAMPYERALQQCLQVAKAMGWEVAPGSVRPEGFEATDSTVFFGFKDDVIVRITPVGASAQATRIDLRSVSRVGRGDRGVNARRIREFFRLLAREPIRLG